MPHDAIPAPRSRLPYLAACFDDVRASEVVGGIVGTGRGCQGGCEPPPAVMLKHDGVQTRPAPHLPQGGHVQNRVERDPRGSTSSSSRGGGCNVARLPTQLWAASHAASCVGLGLAGGRPPHHGGGAAWGSPSCGGGLLGRGGAWSWGHAGVWLPEVGPVRSDQPCCSPPLSTCSQRRPAHTTTPPPSHTATPRLPNSPHR